MKPIKPIAWRERAAEHKRRNPVALTGAVEPGAAGYTRDRFSEWLAIRRPIHFGEKFPPALRAELRREKEALRAAILGVGASDQPASKH